MKPIYRCSMNQGGKNSQLSYMWVYVAGPPDYPVVWFQYAESRSGAVPEEFLSLFDAEQAHTALYLITDGYDGYNALSQSPCILGHAACWEHVRRKVVEATHGRKHTATAHQMVALIRMIY